MRQLNLSNEKRRNDFEKWFICPICGQKLHKVLAGAHCEGILTVCKRCRNEVEIKVPASTEAKTE